MTFSDMSWVKGSEFGRRLVAGWLAPGEIVWRYDRVLSVQISPKRRRIVRMEDGVDMNDEAVIRRVVESCRIAPSLIKRRCGALSR